MPTRISIIELLVILRAFRAALRTAFPGMFPNLDDPKEVYAWTRRAVELASHLARLTPTKVDDSVTAWLLANVLANDGTFQPYYQIFRLILDAVRRGDSDNTIAVHLMDLVPPADIDRLIPPDAAVSASGAPIDRIMTIIRLIRLLIEIISDNNQPQNAGG